MNTPHEGISFVSAAIADSMTPEDFIRNMAPLFSAKQISEAAALYTSAFTDMYDLASAVHGESALSCISKSVVPC